jgi:hypothetical protein
MTSTSRRFPLAILGIAALACSRSLFLAFNDPEGPNLLIVIGMAAIIYVISLVAYVFGSLDTGFKRFSAAVVIQLLVAVGFYVLLK